MVSLGWFGALGLIAATAISLYANSLVAKLHLYGGRRHIRYRDLAGFIYVCLSFHDQHWIHYIGWVCFEGCKMYFSWFIGCPPEKVLLGRRETSNGKAGQYVWLTYKEVHDSAIRIGSAIRSLGVNPGDRCGIYGTNCPEWIVAMEACNSQAIAFVPLYDTLGPDAVEFIVNHAEISLAFVQETKLQAMLKCLSNCNSYLKSIVRFGEVSDSQKEKAQEHGVSCFSCKEFAQLGNMEDKLPSKSRSDICTIMYTSGTTGEPKGVILPNVNFMAEVMSMDYLLGETNKVFDTRDCYFSFLPLAHIFDQIVETYCIYKGTFIGFWQGDVRLLMEDL